MKASGLTTIFLLFMLLISLTTFMDLLYVGLPNALEVKVAFVPDNYTSINEALNVVPAGGVVYVRSGIYAEQIYITKPVSIIGLGDVKIVEPITIISTINVKLVNITVIISPPGSEISILIYNSTGINVINSTIAYSGITISASNNVLITNTLFLFIPHSAILVNQNSSNITVEKCFFQNTFSALTVMSGHDIVFRLNNINNTKGNPINLRKDAKNVLIYLNNFLGNNNVLDNGEGNLWYNPKYKLGNYWDKYAVKELDKNNDNILDKPFSISGLSENYDMYPLLYPYEEYLDILKKYETTAPINTKIKNQEVYLTIAASIIVLLTVLTILKKRGKIK